jgi:replicative DNA helicase
MASISNMLKESALSVGTPIVAAAQINRDGDSAGWRPPKVKNLSQSDALGQDGDVVLTHKQYGKTAMVYSVEKNRNGEQGSLFFTAFEPDTGNMREINKATAENLKDESED